MKLSEAIRAGAKIRPQGFGSFFPVVRRWFGVKREKLSCAMGAAFEGGSCKTKIETVSRAFIGREGQLIQAGETVESVYPHDEWVPVLTLTQSCPQCEKQDNVNNVIQHLNDDHKWKREEIALWVARMEEVLEMAQRITELNELENAAEWPNEINV